MGKLTRDLTCVIDFFRTCEFQDLESGSIIGNAKKCMELYLLENLQNLAHVLNLLKEIGMLGCKPTNAPMECNDKLGLKNEYALVDEDKYQCLVGKLIYLSHIKPYIGFLVSVISQFMDNPNEEHLETVYGILRYLLGIWLFFKKGIIKRLNYTLMLIGQDRLLIGDLLYVIILMFRGTL